MRGLAGAFRRQAPRAEALAKARPAHRRGVHDLAQSERERHSRAEGRKGHRQLATKAKRRPVGRRFRSRLTALHVAPVLSWCELSWFWVVLSARQPASCSVGTLFRSRVEGDKSGWRGPVHRVNDRFEHQVIVWQTDSTTNDGTVIGCGPQFMLYDCAG